MLQTRECFVDGTNDTLYVPGPPDSREWLLAGLWRCKLLGRRGVSVAHFCVRRQLRRRGRRYDAGRPGGLWVPSTIASTGDLSGVADLTFLNGELYALLAGNGCSDGNPLLPNGVVRIDLSSGKWHYVADLSAALVAHPAAYPSKNDTEPDGEWYSIVAEAGDLYVSEPNHAQIFRVTTDGATSVDYGFLFPFADVTPRSRFAKAISTLATSGYSPFVRKPHA